MNHDPLNYQLLDHTADMGMVVEGADVKEVFVNAANAMTDLMVEGDMGGKGAKRQITIEGEDYSDLMVRWLGEILYLFDAEHLLANGIVIKSINPTRLLAELILTRLKKAQYQILREIKAVTYHQISVQRVHDGWEARIIFDI